MHDPEQPYPPDAYTETGELWWELEFWPGKKMKYGAERKIAAWLAYNVDEGERFTIRDLRRALGDDVVPNDDEHLNRRFRQLRKDGWEVPSNKDDKSLATGVYRLDKVGWHPGVGADRPKQRGISQSDTRRVIERDGRRCVICGVGSGEPYANEPTSKAVLTAGHRLARELGGGNELNNLQAECKRCNEPVREEMGVPESLEDVMVDVRRLRKEELEKLLAWLRQGYRGRDRLDVVYDRARALSPDERTELLAKVQQRLGGATS